jgi:hypothetical protein
MSELLPQGEKLRRAVKWISAQLTEDPALKVSRLVEEAITLYDLNPFESELLIQFYQSNPKNDQ